MFARLSPPGPAATPHPPPPREGTGSERRRSESRGRFTWPPALDSLRVTVQIQDPAGVPPQTGHVVSASGQREGPALSAGCQLQSGSQEGSPGIQARLAQKELSTFLLVGRAAPSWGLRGGLRTVAPRVSVTAESPLSVSSGARP